MCSIIRPEKSQLGALEIPLIINVALTWRGEEKSLGLSSLPPCRILSFQMRPREQIQQLPHYSIPGFLNLESEPAGADKGK